jgi:hypothetical protein
MPSRSVCLDHFVYEGSHGCRVSSGQVSGEAKRVAHPSFAGRVALVTGAASGIGRATAIAFAAAGARVVLADIVA